MGEVSWEDSPDSPSIFQKHVNRKVRSSLNSKQDQAHNDCAYTKDEEGVVIVVFNKTSA